MLFIEEADVSREGERAGKLALSLGGKQVAESCVQCDTTMETWQAEMTHFMGKWMGQ